MIPDRCSGLYLQLLTKMPEKWIGIHTVELVATALTRSVAIPERYPPVPTAPLTPRVRFALVSTLSVFIIGLYFHKSPLWVLLVLWLAQFSLVKVCQRFFFGISLSLHCFWVTYFLAIRHFVWVLATWGFIYLCIVYYAHCTFLRIWAFWLWVSKLPKGLLTTLRGTCKEHHPQIIVFYKISFSVL